MIKSHRVDRVSNSRARLAAWMTQHVNSPLSVLHRHAGHIDSASLGSYFPNSGLYKDLG